MTRYTFAIVVGEDVAATVGLEDGFSDATDRTIAAYLSDPKIIQIPDASIGFGWKYDGLNFIPPQGS